MKTLTKNNLKSICRGIAFVLVFLVGFYYLSLVFTPLRDDAADGFSKNMEFSYRGESKNCIDVVFLGNSDVARGVNPIQIWKDYNITACTIGPSAATAQTVYEKLQDIIKYQNPKIAVIDADCLFFASNDYYASVTRDYNVTKVANMKKANIKEALDNFNEEILSGIAYYWPLMKHHSRWNSLELKSFDLKRTKYKYSAKGYMFTEESVEFRYANEYMNDKTDQRTHFRSETNKYFDKIYALCRDNNIQLTLMAVPSGSSWSMEKHNSTQWLSEKYNLDFVDYNTDSEFINIFNWKTDTKDAGNHLNYSGATKLTAAYAKHLTETFGLTPSNISTKEREIWENDCDIFYKELMYEKQ